ncbi:unnamed protein product, partial [Rotaria socialis]
EENLYSGIANGWEWMGMAENGLEYLSSRARNGPHVLPGRPGRSESRAENSGPWSPGIWFGSVGAKWSDCVFLI